MSTIGMSFGIMGLILSMVAMSQSASATAKIQALEKKLENAGVIDNEGLADSDRRQ